MCERGLWSFAPVSEFSVSSGSLRVNGHFHNTFHSVTFQQLTPGSMCYLLSDWLGDMCYLLSDWLGSMCYLLSDWLLDDYGSRLSVDILESRTDSLWTKKHSISFAITIKAKNRPFMTCTTSVHRLLVDRNHVANFRLRVG